MTVTPNPIVLPTYEAGAAPSSRVATVKLSKRRHTWTAALTLRDSFLLVGTSGMSGDTFTVVAKNGLTEGEYTDSVYVFSPESGSASVAIELTVSPAQNAAPVAYGQSLATDVDGTLAITLSASDDEGDPLTYSVLLPPLHGLLDDTNAPELVYTPDPGFIGSDSFTFIANDGTDDSGAAKVSIIVGNALFLYPVAWDLGNQRWSDIADNMYDPNTTSQYLYPSGGVLFQYGGTVETLEGTFTGSGLKPNFAYQIKLNGKPSYVWGADGDDWGNEQLGYAGRWWTKQIDSATGVEVGGWNGTDSEYESWKSQGFTDGTFDYVFEGYLLFDFGVTDAAGVLSQTVSLDSSLHVLWKTSQTSPAAEDTTPRPFTVTANAASAWYDQDHTTQVVSTFGQWEPGRALPGTLALASGEYNVRMFLTEESFHSSNGYWATVLAFDHLVFTIQNGSNSPPVAASDSYDVNENEALFIDAPGVFQNDSDPDADTLDAILVSATVNGSLLLNADGSFEYIPDADFAGVDMFSYRAFDGAAYSAVTTVTITVTPDAAALNLSAVGFKIRAIQCANLTWTGGTSAAVDIYRNAALIASSIAGGAYTDNTGTKGGGSFTYQVIELGTGTPSNVVTVTF